MVRMRLEWKLLISTLAVLIIISLSILVLAVSQGTYIYSSHVEERFIAVRDTVDHADITYPNGTFMAAWTENIVIFVKKNVTVNDNIIGFMFPDGQTIRYSDNIIINETAVSIFDVPIGDRVSVGCLDYEIEKGVCEVVYQE